MKYILAISGGVDSVVLLNKVISQDFGIDKNDIIIAHFDHGIRRKSGRDAEFVRELAQKYNLLFVLGKAKLGKNASEKTARKARYDFLRNIPTGLESKKIVTAHHKDDLVETIVMNILRGTGWRGLTPFWSDDIIRPLINMTKAEIIKYAIEYDLNWVEDETNYDSKYFRNRIRSALSGASQEQKNDLIKLYVEQKNIRQEVEETLRNTREDSVPKVEAFKKLDDNIGIEVLNEVTSGRLTNPQLKRLLGFLRAAKSGDICQPGGGLQVSVYHGDMSFYDLAGLTR